MTNSQYIEVAEKLWGWEEGANNTVNRKPYVKGVKRVYDFYELGKLVLSWQGFGRTLEAMAKRKAYFIGKGFYWWNEYGHQSVSVEWKSEQPLELIEATHLSALEAVREEKQCKPQQSKH